MPLKDWENDSIPPPKKEPKTDVWPCLFIAIAGTSSITGIFVTIGETLLR